MKENLILLGSGGHAKVIIDIFERQGLYNIIGILTADETLIGSSVLGIPILGLDDLLEKNFEDGIKNAFVAVGYNALRADLYRKVIKYGYKVPNAIHPSACIGKAVQLGAGIAIMAGVVVNPCALIGDNVILNTNSIIEHDCIVANHSHIAPGAKLAGKVVVGAYSFVGTGACVIPQVSIGEYCTIGAGAVVIRDLISGSTAVGVPAKVINVKEVEIC